MSDPWHLMVCSNPLLLEKLMHVCVCVCHVRRSGGSLLIFVCACVSAHTCGYIIASTYNANSTRQRSPTPSWNNNCTPCLKNSPPTFNVLPYQSLSAELRYRGQGTEELVRERRCSCCGGSGGHGIFPSRMSLGEDGAGRLFPLCCCWC